MRPDETSPTRPSATRGVGLRRTRLAFLATVALLSLVAPGAAQAGGPTFTFNIAGGGGCVSGTGPASSTIELTLLDRNDKVIDTQTVYSDPSGNWSTQDCFWFRINGTDKIRAESASYSRTFVVPVLTININRVSDVIKGRAPAAGSFHLYTTACEGYNCDPGPDVNVNVRADGTYSRDFTALRNLKGGDRAFGRWTSPSGDTVDSVERRAPRMEVVIGDRTVDGYGKVNQYVTVQLKTAGGTLIGSGVDQTGLRFTNFQVDLKTPSGDPAYPRVGNKVVSNIASDASLTIPNITLTLSDADTVTGHCFANADVYVYLDHYQPNYAWTEIYLTSGAAGNFTFDIADTYNPSFVPAPGDRFEVDCHNGKGDLVARYAHLQ